ncbi:MAG TPA: hypothetical protein PLW93_03935 [Candidatus Absconditabacterales bacterium]|nr:hypothetical protein [Candidatus Absconditabacterales bacterium]
MIAIAPTPVEPEVPINLKKAIYEYLSSLPELSETIQGRVFRKRSQSQTQVPFIVYDVSGYENKLGKYQGTHGYQGNKLTIDIIGNYEIEDQLREIGEIIISKLGGFIGKLRPSRKGTINLMGVDEGYDEKTDYSIFRLMFLCKHTF